MPMTSVAILAGIFLMFGTFVTVLAWADLQSARARRKRSVVGMTKAPAARPATDAPPLTRAA